MPPFTIPCLLSSTDWIKLEQHDSPASRGRGKERDSVQKCGEGGEEQNRQEKNIKKMLHHLPFQVILPGHHSFRE
jgi:hypothetical protein